MTTPKRTPTVHNVMRVMRLVDEESMIEGLTWYDRARAYAATLDPNNVSRAAGIIAALSPLNSWPQNVKYARAVYNGEDYGYMGNGKGKASRIYAGETPLDVLGGNKVRSFYLNIIGDDSLVAVTIDRHAIDIACGIVQDDKARNKWVSSNKKYWAMAALYQRAARRYNSLYGTDYSPAQIQAITWVWWRKNRAVANHKGEV